MRADPNRDNLGPTDPALRRSWEREMARSLVDVNQPHAASIVVGRGGPVLMRSRREAYLFAEAIMNRADETWPKEDLPR